MAVVDDAPGPRVAIGEDRLAVVLFQDRDRGERAPGAARKEQRIGLRRFPHGLSPEFEGEPDSLIEASSQSRLSPHCPSLVIASTSISASAKYLMSALFTSSAQRLPTATLLTPMCCIAAMTASAAASPGTPNRSCV